MALTDYGHLPETGSVTIANGASLSGALDLGGCQLVAIQMPAAWTAAGLTFQGSYDGSTYQNLYDDAGNEVSMTVAASRYIVFDGDIGNNMAGIRFIKVRSGTSGAAVNQGAERVLQLIARP